MVRTWTFRLKVVLLVLLGLFFSLGIDMIPANSQITSFPKHTKLTQQLELTTHPDRLLQKGKNFYQLGKFPLAAKLLTQAANIYQSRGDILNQVLALNYLSLTEQKQGNLTQATENVRNSLNLLNGLKLNSDPVKKILALTLNTQGNLQLTQGKAEEAIKSWNQAAKIYGEVNDETGKIGSQINEITALQSLGFYQRSQKIFKEIEQTLRKQPNLGIKVAGLRSLGDIKRANGHLKESTELLKQSLVVAEKLRSPQEESATLLSLGNTEFLFGRRSQLRDAGNGNKSSPFSCGRITKKSEALGHYRNSANFYQKSASKSTSKIGEVQAKLNYLRALLELQQQPKVEELRSLQTEIDSLSPSRSAVYAKVNFAQSLVCFAQQENPSQEKNYQNLENVARLLTKAIKQAKELGDTRSESYALGNLARVYEYNKQSKIASQYTKSALLLAQNINASDIKYQWEWQLGRILLKQGDAQGAIKAYTLAIESLQSLRSDLVALNPDTQFDFRDEVEPLYRQLVSLLLEPSNVPSKNLKQARDVIEALQLAQIDNFFRDACSIAQPKRIDQIVDDGKIPTAVIYPIILPDHIETVVKLSRVKELRHYRTKKPQSEVENTLKLLRQKVQQRFTFSDREQLSQEVYNWLIKPIEKDLEKHKIKNLVFVLDDFLRNIPMAALYDGKHYLMEKYSLALAPGLQLVTPSEEDKKLRALTGGITEPRGGFRALPHVATELEKIQSKIPSIKILNDSFTNENIEKQVTSVSYPIIHLATHGKFSSQVEDTFILTWNERINAKELKEVLQSREELQGKRFRKLNPIELLVLSACETATGDERAALGLAGIAVRSGARSTVASLWRVDDESTSVLMAEFYEQLAKNPNISKAEALSEAQRLVFRKHQPHPFYWAPYVLVGNWF